MNCRSKLKTFFMAMLSSIALMMSYDIPEVPVVGIDNSVLRKIYELIAMCQEDLSDNGFIIGIAALMFFFFFKFIFYKVSFLPRRSEKVIAGILATLYAGGRGYAHGYSMGQILTSSYRLLRFILIILGFYYIFHGLIRLTKYLIDIAEKWEINVFFEKIDKTWKFWNYWLLVFVVWFVNLMLHYPGLMSYDNRHELAYYFGYENFSDIQPVFHTWLFGTFVSVGKHLGSVNLGLFSFLLMQCIIFSLIVAYALWWMKEKEVSFAFRLFSIGLYFTSVFYVNYIAFPVKDMLYAPCFLLFFVLLCKFIDDTDELANSRSNVVLFVLSVSGMILFRNNGIYIYIITAIGMIFMLLIKRRVAFKKTLVYLIIMICPVIITMTITGGIRSYYNVSDNGQAEVFSLTYQQLGRYAKYHGDDLSEEERKIIGQVLDYDNLADNYNELTADPIKSTFNGNADSEQIKDYLSVWAKCFFRHPICYIEATWNQNYYLFYPDTDQIIFNKNCYVGEEVVEDLGMNSEIKFSIPSVMTDITDIMYAWYSLLVSFPVIGLASNIAFYIFLFVVIILLMLEAKMRRELLVLVPLLLSFIMIFLSPQLYQQPRYVFPIIYSVPVLLGYYEMHKKSAGLQ